MAIDSNAKDIQNALIEKGADLKIRDPEGYSLLHLAAEKGDLELIKMLIDKGLDSNEKVQN